MTDLHDADDRAEDHGRSGGEDRSGGADKGGRDDGPGRGDAGERGDRHDGGDRHDRAERGDRDAAPAPLPAPRRDRGAARPGEPEPVPVADLPAALEAVLMVVDEPADEALLGAVLGHPAARVRAVLDDLSGQYTAAGRGFDLRRVAGGWRFYSRPEHAAAVERFVLDGRTSRLTQAALETLAVVAYRQPVSRSRVAAVRGVNCDAVMRTLQARGLIEECGTEPGSGAVLYRTTGYFLDRMGLTDLAELPDPAPFLPEPGALDDEPLTVSAPGPRAGGARPASGARPDGDTGGDIPDGDRGHDHGLDD